VEYNSVMTARDYEAAEVGQKRGEIDLPTLEMLEPPTWLGVPEDDGCAYYCGDQAFDEDSLVYRLCFKDDILTSKDAYGPEERRE
ncbi:MAG: hypothetical protein ACRDXX_18225, partial [Stackebrandtia sp.]